MLRGEEYTNYKVDIWQASILLFVLAFRRYPSYDKKGESDYYHKLLLDGELEMFWENFPSNKISNELFDMLNWIWQKEEID